MAALETTMTSYAAEAERLASSRRKDVDKDPEWVERARLEGLARFQKLGFPTTRDEEWRFTSVAPIVEGGFALARNGVASVTNDDVLPWEWPGERAATLVFVNGRYAEAISRVGSLSSGVRVLSLARAIAQPELQVDRHFARVAAHDRHAFTALNTAFVDDGAFVEIHEGTILEAPIHLLFLSAGEGEHTMSHPRVLVALGAHSQAAIVETYGAARPGTYFTNAVTDIAAGEGAFLHHYKVQRETPASVHIGAIYLRAERNANVACHSISLGGCLVRNEVVAVLGGEGAECTLNGLYAIDGSRLVDNHTTIDHAMPHCGSREVYKGILADRSRAVFNGKIIVRPDAQKTDAKQTNKALLLSEEAQINTKPQLEIFANDVKCTHGAAVGQMDDDAIFYLRARGIDERAARQLLVRAFAADVLNQMPLLPLRSRIDEELAGRLPGWTS